MPLKINHAILHVFDFVACENTFAVEGIDLTNKNAKNYVSRMAKKGLENLDNMHGSFAEGSTFAAELSAYFAGQRDFVGLSAQIGEFLVGELGHMEKTPSCDLLVVDFEDSGDAPAPDADADDQEALAAFSARTNRYFALFILESKQAYMHELDYGETGPRNGILRNYATLPSPSQKLTSYAVVNLRNLSVLFCDKPRTIAGEERWLIPDGLLQCSMEASSKETFTAVTEIVEAVAEEFGMNTAVATSKAKAYATQNAEESDDLDLVELAEDIFEDDEVIMARFHEEVQQRQMPDQVPLEPKAVKRVAKNHKIRTDTGIEITFPAEYSQNPEYMTFTSEADGTISIQLKNIGHLENR